ncbi:MAG: twin-arginine translocation signal domain-containing protein [Chloroflexi bacterium]|nr:twin-arginine translocation signal domain-containing protein [Chloroflexota bacterium]
MPKNHSNTKGDRQSRRSFLAKLGLGVAIAAIASLPLGNRGQGHRVECPASTVLTRGRSSTGGWA